MKISIITTAYNAEKYIEETLESVLSQRGDFELEYIVIDAKSTDTTLEKIRKYKKLVDEGFYTGRNKGIQMQVLSEKDEGMYDGISKGFKLATGDVLAYINADDFYLPNAFDCVCNIFSKYPQISWLTGIVNSYNSRGHIIYREDLTIYDRNFIKQGLYGKQYPWIEQESCFWRKDLMDKIDLQEFMTFKLAGDFYLWYNFANYTDLYSVDSLLSGFRHLPIQKSTDKEAYFKEYNQICSKPCEKEYKKLDHFLLQGVDTDGWILYPDFERMETRLRRKLKKARTLWRVFLVILIILFLVSAGLGLIIFYLCHPKLA